jgi:hypothetical protein
MSIPTPADNAERNAKFIARADEGTSWAQIARETSPAISAERIRQIVQRERRRVEARRNGWVSVREQIALNRKSRSKLRAD